MNKHTWLCTNKKFFLSTHRAVELAKSIMSHKNCITRNLVQIIAACTEKKYHEPVVNNSVKRKTDSMETYQMDGEGKVLISLHILIGASLKKFKHCIKKYLQYLYIGIRNTYPQFRPIRKPPWHIFPMIHLKRVTFKTQTMKTSTYLHDET